MVLTLQEKIEEVKLILMEMGVDELVDLCTEEKVQKTCEETGKRAGEVLLDLVLEAEEVCF